MELIIISGSGVLLGLEVLLLRQYQSDELHHWNHQKKGVGQ
jgi:hypothetical protein